MIPSDIPSALTLDHWMILSVFKPRFFSLEQMKTSLSNIFFVNACMVYMKNPISTGYRVLEDHLKGLDCFFLVQEVRGRSLQGQQRGPIRIPKILEFFRKLLSDAFKKKHPGMVWVNAK